MLPCIKFQAASLRTAGLSDMPWISHSTSLWKAENMELPPLWKRHCSKKPLTILTDILQILTSILQKRKQFCNKSNCHCFVCITNKHLRWLVWPRHSQSNLHYSNICVTVCAADSPLTNTGYGVQLDMSMSAEQTASGHELCLGSLRSFLWLLKKAKKVGTVHSNLQNCMFSLATLSHLVHKVCLQS